MLNNLPLVLDILFRIFLCRWLEELVVVDEEFRMNFRLINLHIFVENHAVVRLND